jgi:hypothetical protein
MKIEGINPRKAFDRFEEGKNVIFTFEQAHVLWISQKLGHIGIVVTRIRKQKDFSKSSGGDEFPIRVNITEGGLLLTRHRSVARGGNNSRLWDVQFFFTVFGK